MLDSAGSVNNDGTPKPGDVTICLHCGHLMAFTEDMRLRELTSQEMLDVAGDPQLQRASRIVGLYKQYKLDHNNRKEPEHD